MDKLLEAVIKAFKALSIFLGFSEEFTNKIDVILTISVVVVLASILIYRIIKYFIERRIKAKLNEDLAPFFSYNDVTRAKKFYIKTRHQSVAPSVDDEPGGKFITTPKAEFMPVFLNGAFLRENIGNKFYLILADSGMGKTTFMINLYINYKNRFKWFFEESGFEIKIIPLGAKTALDAINKCEKKSETILLLDAFDEDILAIADYEKRLAQILEAVKDFRTVVMSCRTQFFPSQKEEPHETGYMTFGGDGEHKFEKSYLSIFNGTDIDHYLKKKYGVFLIHKRRKAKKIVKQCPNLMVRPMLLSHIDDLVNTTETITYTFELYAILIERWVIRESKKPGVKEKYRSQEAYQNLLLKFSQKLARNFYDNAKKRKGYFLPKDTDFKVAGLDKTFLEDQNLTLSENDGRSRSLLNRDAEGNYKFAHKSFFEYFLAKELLIDLSLSYGFPFKGLDMAYTFFVEMIKTEIGQTEGIYLGLTKFDSSASNLPNISYDTYLTWADDFEILKLSCVKDSVTIYNVPRTVEFLHYINFLIVTGTDLSDTIELLKKTGLDNILEFIRQKTPLETIISSNLKVDLTNVQSGETASKHYYKIPFKAQSLRPLNNPKLLSNSAHLEFVYREYYHRSHMLGFIDLTKALQGFSHSIDLQRTVAVLEQKIKFKTITNAEVLNTILALIDYDTKQKILIPLDKTFKKINTLKTKNNHSNIIAIPLYLSATGL